MVWYNVTDGKSSKEVILYDEWDVPEDMAVEFATTNIEDEGKYARFTDGTNLYVVVIKVTPRLIYTEVGAFRRADVVHCCVPKRQTSNVYPLDNDFVHPLVKPYCKKERNIVNKLLSGEQRRFNVTPRVKMLTLEKLKERAEVKGLTEDEIMDQIINVAKNSRSIHWKWSMTLMMHAHGMDPNNYVFSHMNQIPEKKVQRITNLGNGSQLTETITLPGVRDIDKMIQSAAGNLAGK